MCCQQTDTYKYLVCVCVCACVCVCLCVCVHACVCYKTHTHTHTQRERETTFTSLISNDKLLLVTAPAHGLSKGHITVPQWKNSGGLQQLEREQEGIRRSRRSREYQSQHDMKPVVPIHQLTVCFGGCFIFPLTIMRECSVRCTVHLTFFWS